MANKAQSKEFFDKVTEAIVKLGAVSTRNEFSYQWVLETIAGKLYVKVDPDSKHCFSVFTKFEDVEKAKEKFASNVFSGKFNFMVGAGNVEKEAPLFTVDKAVELAMIHLERTQP